MTTLDLTPEELETLRKMIVEERRSPGEALELVREARGPEPDSRVSSAVTSEEPHHATPPHRRHLRQASG